MFLDSSFSARSIPSDAKGQSDSEARHLVSAIPSLILFAYAGLLFFYGLGDRDLLSSHEARAAQNAQMIVNEGCWLLPRLFDGHLEMQKPPLYYWLVAIFGHLFGGEVNAWAVRLPSALSALGCVLFLYFMLARCGRPRAGPLAGLILASCLHFTWLARVGRIDMPLTFTVTVAAGAFHLGMKETNKRRWFLLGYVSIAAGILLKGPIAMLLVSAVVGPCAYLASRERKRPEVLASLWWGGPLILVLAAPWFIWANIESGNQVWDVFFRYHNFERGLGSSDTLASHPIWFYLPRILVDLLPWSLALLPAAWFFLRGHGWTQDGDARFGLIWFTAVFALLSCMSFKRADYLLPAYPGAALFLGCRGERILDRPLVRRAFAAVVIACGLGWATYATWIVPRQDAGWPYRQLARDIRSQTTMPVIFFRAESHVLAFHVGRPLDTILEWENLDAWASKSTPVYFVMPADCADEWRDRLVKGKLEVVFRTADQSWGKKERPLVVMRSYP